MINAIPLVSIILGVRVFEFTEGTNHVVNPVVGIRNFNASTPALVLMIEDTYYNNLWSADVYGNLNLNDWGPDEEFGEVLAAALNEKGIGVTFTPGSFWVSDNPDMVFSI